METTQILLVDDDPQLLQALSQTVALRMIGVEVQTADSAKQALALLEERQYDAIISDIKMPGIDGLELLAWVQERHPATPMLLITGHGDHQLAIQALRGGAYDYILKPIERDEFIAALHRALQTHQLRRQLAQQQQALEHSVLSLEHLVEGRTRDLAHANREKEIILTLVTQELSACLSSLRGVTQGEKQPRPPADEIEMERPGLASSGELRERLILLLGNLQDLLLLQTGQMTLHRTTCDLVALCQQVVDAYGGTTGVVSHLEVLDHPLPIEGDPKRISQVVFLLLTQVHTSFPQTHAPILLLRHKDTEVILSVYGSGYSPPVGGLPHQAAPWDGVPLMERQSNALAGEMVELFLAQALVDQQGGRLVAQTAPEGGKTFSVLFPLADLSRSR